MTGFDIFAITILLVSMLIGLWRGLLYEVLSLLGWPIAFVLSRLSADSIAPMLPIEESMRIATAYALVFIAALIVWSILTRMISKMLKAMGSVWTDRAMGGLFGIVRGVLVLLVLTWLSGLTHIPERPFWRDALTSKAMEEIALMTKSWLPADVEKRVHYRNRS